MRQELDEALVRDFPNLYRRRNADPASTCMCWGFEVGDGWEPLIRELSARLEPLIQALPEGERADYHAVQVKEKFGGLRFYLSRGTDEMFALTDQAEAKSYKTCESCGADGCVRRGSWIRVRCDGCSEGAPPAKASEGP